MIALRRGLPTFRWTGVSSSLNRCSFSSTIPPLPPTNKRDNKDDTATNSRSKRHFHPSPSNRADAMLDGNNATPVTASSDTMDSSKGSLLARFTTTFEVTVSKIFPAGFGWQTGGIVAHGMQMDGMNFALMTGLGDALGVLGGHVLYYSLKKQLGMDDTINMTKELHTGTLLASAAFCSGTAWQPVVNALQGAGCSFNEVFGGTFVLCGLSFYGGLRLGRTFLPLSTIERPTFENSCTDAALSTSIGGAAGFFTGTDAVYLPDQNFLIDIVGIADGTPDITGAVIAGTSTSLGFCTVQSALNASYPKGKCWND